MEESGKRKIASLIEEYYNLTMFDSEKISEKIIVFIEEECLEWNHISCQWEVK